MLSGLSMIVKKKYTKTDWSKDIVEFKVDDIHLSTDNYISRKKVLDSNNNWIDTQPVNINDNVDKSLGLSYIVSDKKKISEEKKTFKYII